jgi:hypothetical protein
MTASHEQWDELAAGYALHALEPDEELLFTEHLRDCDDCAALLADHELVAAQLGSLAHDDADLRPPDWSAIRGGVVAPRAEAEAEVTSLDARRRPRLRRPWLPKPWLLGAAAAALVVAGAGVVVGQNIGGSSTSPATQAMSSCRHRAGCTVVQLHASHGADPAVVLVDGGRATVVPVAMDPPAQGKQYVLWQLLRTGAPTPVDGFRDTDASSSAPLVMPYDDTAAFAISLEDTTWPPAQPTRVMAVGNTPA